MKAVNLENPFNWKWHRKMGVDMTEPRKVLVISVLQTIPNPPTNISQFLSLLCDSYLENLAKKETNESVEKTKGSHVLFEDLLSANIQLQAKINELTEMNLLMEAQIDKFIQGEQPTELQKVANYLKQGIKKNRELNEPIENTNSSQDSSENQNQNTEPQVNACEVYKSEVVRLKGLCEKQVGIMNSLSNDIRILKEFIETHSIDDAKGISSINADNPLFADLEARITALHKQSSDFIRDCYKDASLRDLTHTEFIFLMLDYCERDPSNEFPFEDMVIKIYESIKSTTDELKGELTESGRGAEK